MLRVLLRFFLLGLGAAYVLNVYSRGAQTPFTYWITGCFSLVVLMRLGAARSLYGKRKDGSVAWWAYFLLGPFLLFRWLLWYWTRLVSREPACAELTSGIWVGRRIMANELPAQVDTVVDLTYEFREPRAIAEKHNYILFPILEGSVPHNSFEFLELIKKLKREPTTLYIHCADGHGRTALVAAALLVAKGISPNLTQAFADFKKARGAGYLTFLQRFFMRRMEPHLCQLRSDEGDAQGSINSTFPEPQ